MLDAMRRMQAQPATPLAFPQDAGNGAAVPDGTGAAGVDSAAKAREAAQSLLTARPEPASRTGRQRKWLLAAGAAALLLPMGGWLGWMMWEASQPSTFAVVPAPFPVPEPTSAPAPAPENTAQNQPVVQSGQTQAAIAPDAPKPVLAVADAAPGAMAAGFPPLAKPAPAPAVGNRKAPALASATAAPASAPPLVVRSEANRQLQDAWTALGQGDAARALGLYRQVLVERPDDPDASLGVAVALHQQKNLTEAWAAYQRSLKLWPDNATARTGLLAILSESDALTAESRLSEWVQSRPRDAAAQAALGNLLGRQARWADALPWLARAQSLEPAQATYAYNLAVALDQSHRYAEAARHYQMALQLGGAGVPVPQVKNRLQELGELGEP
jgi:tetratricopeptide (TPR) repeat protein